MSGDVGWHGTRLVVDEVEVGELARDGTGTFLAGGGLLLLGQEVAPGVARLVFLVLGARTGCHHLAAVSMGHEPSGFASVIPPATKL